MSSPSEFKGVNPQDTLQVLLDSKAIIANDHFVYVSGDHGAAGSTRTRSTRKPNESSISVAISAASSAIGRSKLFAARPQGA